MTVAIYAILGRQLLRELTTDFPENRPDCHGLHYRDSFTRVIALCWNSRKLYLEIPGRTLSLTAMPVILIQESLNHLLMSIVGDVASRHQEWVSRNPTPLGA